VNQEKGLASSSVFAKQITKDNPSTVAPAAELEWPVYV
jgi:hypothetical protein